MRVYAEAKSRQDAAAALALCADDFSIETIPFGTASHGRDDTARQLALVFSVFPDYCAETEGMAGARELALTRRVPGLKLFDIKCAWFNEHEYCEMFPRTLFLKR